MKGGQPGSAEAGPTWGGWAAQSPRPCPQDSPPRGEQPLRGRLLPPSAFSSRTKRTRLCGDPRATLPPGRARGRHWARGQPAALSRNAQSSITGAPRETSQGWATVVTEAANSRSGCSVASPLLPARHGARGPSAAGETLALQGFLTWGLGAAGTCQVPWNGLSWGRTFLTL